MALPNMLQSIGDCGPCLASRLCRFEGWTFHQSKDLICQVVAFEQRQWLVDLELEEIRGNWRPSQVIECNVTSSQNYFEPSVTSHISFFSRSLLFCLFENLSNHYCSPSHEKPPHIPLDSKPPLVKDLIVWKPPLVKDHIVSFSKPPL